MKIKQVSKLTDLSERTIRFYEQEKLINPDQKLMNGRSFREYSQADVDALLTVSSLRRAFFTIQDIREMMETPDRIPHILENYKARTRQEAEVKTRIVKMLDNLDPDRFKDIVSLSASLQSATRNLSLPQMDAQPNFGRFDNISKEEREQEYKDFLVREEKRWRKGRSIVLIIATINALYAVLGAVINFNLFTLVVQIALSIALYAGVRWVRYWFIFGSFISLVMLVDILIYGAFFMLGSFEQAFLIIGLAFSVASCIFLLKSSSVREFLYSQKGV